MNKRLRAWTLALMSLSLSACATAQSVPVGTCQPVVGQVEINAAMQQISGTACLQPDGTWQMVDSEGNPVTYVGPPYYMDDTWYWAPAGAVFGSVIFIDRFHHVHHMHNAFFHHGDHDGGRGGFGGRFRGGHEGGHGGGHDHDGGRGGGMQGGGMQGGGMQGGGMQGGGARH